MPEGQTGPDQGPLPEGSGAVPKPEAAPDALERDLFPQEAGGVPKPEAAPDALERDLFPQEAGGVPKPEAAPDALERDLFSQGAGGVPKPEAAPDALERTTPIADAPDIWPHDTPRPEKPAGDEETAAGGPLPGRSHPEATPAPVLAARLFDRLTLAERNWTIAALRNETTGGLLLLIAAGIALAVANSPWGDWYARLSETVVGPAALHLDLSLAVWAADGLLAVFFFVAGIELRHEFQLGTLANRSTAVVPVAAAIGGMVVPALIYFALNSTSNQGRPEGWAIPMATDIAFALAVLAVVGRNLPVALRAFLLSLAVVDDLGAILVIALFYSQGVDFGMLAASTACLALFGVLQGRRVRGWPVYLALAVLAWGFMHASGVHATVAGVACGLLMRVRPDPGEEESPGHRAQRTIQPISAGVAVPVFAFFAAGVNLRGIPVLDSLASPVGLGVMLGLIVGKPIGVIGTTALVARFTRAQLSSSLRWRDVTAVGLLGGIGFTVSLLIAELAFAGDRATLATAKISVLLASVISALVASGLLVSRNRFYAALRRREEADENADGIPDVYQRGDVGLD